jgi:hypothetical protein
VVIAWSKEKKMVYFNNISPQAWEHPADKAALNALKQLKGFDQLFKYYISVTNEREEKLQLRKLLQLWDMKWGI